MKPEYTMVFAHISDSGERTFTWAGTPPAIYFDARGYPEAVADVKAKGYRNLESPYDRFDQIWVRPLPRWLLHKTGHALWCGYHAARRWLYYHRILNVCDGYSIGRTCRVTDLRLWPFGKRL